MTKREAWLRIFEDVWSGGQQLTMAVHSDFSWTVWAVGVPPVLPYGNGLRVLFDSEAKVKFTVDGEWEYA